MIFILSNRKLQKCKGLSMIKIDVELFILGHLKFRALPYAPCFKLSRSPQPGATGMKTHKFEL